MNKKVLLGMSGGIDSTVSAMLLLEQGYELVGVTFRTYDSVKESCIANEKGCCTIDSIMEARANARKMGFEHHIVDYRDVFREKVIQNFADEYMAGRTPNPCVLCNCWIKWGEMLRLADELGCQYIATGHYARIENNFLRIAADEKKDQTYFLWRLTEEQLSRTLFPLGDYTKDQVREMARERGYVRLAEKKESQDICFVPGGDYKAFLRDYLPDFDTRVQPGNYVDAQGKILGVHQGCCNYTIGQRKGLGIALGTPAFVTKIDTVKNEVTLGRNEDLFQTDVHLREGWFRGDASRPVLARIRYRSQATEAQVVITPEKQMSLRFSSPVWGVTPGQSCVMYQDDLLVGGGVIE